VGSDITVLISSSPILSHPSNEIVAETIRSVQHQLPDAPIVLMCDGVRPEQESKRAAYSGYLESLGSLPVSVVIEKEFCHQALMTMHALEQVETPFVLFVEHDTPIVDRFIDWMMFKQQLSSGTTNMIRCHYDETIHPEHQYLMRGKSGTNLIKTIQWSQRPHLANTQWYGDLLKANFNLNSRTFIEDKIYSPVVNAPWEAYRLTIYDPEGNGQMMKRSGNLDGRSTEPKYGMVF